MMLSVQSVGDSTTVAARAMAIALTQRRLASRLASSLRTMKKRKLREMEAILLLRKVLM
jgi:hypothetical protein